MCVTNVAKIRGIHFVEFYVVFVLRVGYGFCYAEKSGYLEIVNLLWMVLASSYMILINSYAEW